MRPVRPDGTRSKDSSKPLAPSLPKPREWCAWRAGEEYDRCGRSNPTRTARAALPRLLSPSKCTPGWETIHPPPGATFAIPRRSPRARAHDLDSSPLAVYRWATAAHRGPAAPHGPLVGCSLVSVIEADREHETRKLGPRPTPKLPRLGGPRNLGGERLGTLRSFAGGAAATLCSGPHLGGHEDVTTVTRHFLSSCRALPGCGDIGARASSTLHDQEP